MAAPPQHLAPDLPPEVTDHIISCVSSSIAWYKARRATLISCALTCKAWLPASLTHLYSPKIAYLLQNTRVITVDSRGSANWEPSAPRGLRLQWIQRALLRLPSLAANATCLFLYHISIAAGSSDPDRMTMACSLWRNVTVLTLLSVEFRSLAQLQRFVRAFPKLDELGIVDVTGPDGRPFLTTLAAGEKVSPRDPALHALSIGAQLLPLVSRWILNDPLRQREIISAVADHLSHLSLHFHYAGVDFTELRLAQCTALRTFRFTVGDFFDSRGTQLFHAFRLLSPSCRLHYLELSANIESLQAWGHVRDVFRLPQFSELREVRFLIMGDVGAAKFVGGSDGTHFEAVESELRARGVLVFIAYQNGGLN